MTAETPTPETSPARWWQSRWVIVIGTLLLTGIAFYLASGWMGTARWHQVQKEAAAAGESLDPASVIPPSVPDDQNFGALPVFKLDGTAPDLQPNALKKALEHLKGPAYYPPSPKGGGYEDPDELPYIGNWSQRAPGDEATIEKKLRLIAKTVTGKEPPANANPLELFTLICPVFADLRTAEPTRPLCRFDADDTTEPAFNRSLGPIVAQIKLAQALGYDETLALRHNRPDIALADILVGTKIDQGVSCQPILVAGLVAIGCTAIHLAPITEGLDRHVWNDSQLAQLDSALDHIDRLSNSQLYMRGETGFAISMFDYLKWHRANVTQLANTDSSFSIYPSEPARLFLLAEMTMGPSGWFDQTKADVTRLYLFSLVPATDPAHHRVYPEKIAHGLDLLKKNAGSSPWSWFESLAPSAVSSGVKKFAVNQVQVDEARIVCKLERYRLAHGAYPASLNDLTAYGPLPNDPMNGEPYHYQLKPDGTFFLYSVGWDQKDDHGTGRGTANISIDNAPDWLWNDYPKPSP